MKTDPEEIKEKAAKTLSIGSVEYQLGYKEALPLLLETLAEEKATDEKLTLLAKAGQKAKAVEPA